MKRAISVTLLDLGTGKAVPCPVPRENSARYAAALGNFDGVHAAHRELLRSAVRQANQRTEQGILTYSAVFCFTSPSGMYTDPLWQGELTTQEEKLRLFAACGIQYAFLADFSTLRDLSPADFITSILRDTCAIDAVSCGFNFRYGKNGSGSVELLRAQFGSLCTVIPCLRMTDDGIRSDTSDGTIISSSTIRHLLMGGDVSFANRLLCRPYSLVGMIEHGKQLGRTIGFPTINLSFPKGKIVPAHGVYASVCRIDDRSVCGVSNIGLRPTVEAAEPAGENGCRVNCETYLLDFHDTVYGKTVRLSFLQKLRGEIKFSDVNRLRAAIAADVAEATSYFKDPFVTIPNIED